MERKRQPSSSPRARIEAAIASRDRRRLLPIFEEYPDAKIASILQRPHRWVANLRRSYGIPSSHDTRHKAADLAERELRTPAEAPCPWAPGTPQRMETYQRRLFAGQEMYHPDDATMATGLRPDDWMPRMFDKTGVLTFLKRAG